MPHRPPYIVQGIAVAAVMVSFVAGCVSNTSSNAPEPIRSFTEPDQGSEYLLYRPSSYDRNYDWPLVVVCHSALGDSPKRQIRDWTQLAEREGFLVVAPTLKAVRKAFARKPSVQLGLQLEDEARILSVVDHVRAGHSVSPDRIFIYGFAGGTHTAMFTGLRHPTIFRAIALMNPAFDEAYLPADEVVGESYQPVFVNYHGADAITVRHGKRCVQWLRTKHADVQVDTSGSAGRDEAYRAISFFEGIIRNTAWMEIHVLPAVEADPMQWQFELRASPKPVKVHWSFGDGDESTVSRPIHVYARPGSYRVGVQATFTDRGSDSRAIMLAVPQGTTTSASTTIRAALPATVTDSPRPPFSRHF